jgi:hypothetical protein
MSIETFGTLLIVVGAILGIVAGVLVAIGAIPHFDDYAKKKSPARKDKAPRHS